MEKGKQLAFRKNDSCRFVSVLLQEWDVEGRENTSAGLKLRLFFLFFFFSEALVRFTGLLLSLQVQALFVILLLFSLFATTLLSVFRKFMKSLQPFFFFPLPQYPCCCKAAS